MKIESATNARVHFGRVIENALVEPVLIEKSGRKIAVVLSFDEYQRVSAIEDRYWAEKAMQAKEEGFIGVEASQALIQEILNAKD
jgi:PHD/YefM family antitoxin component YafN of YafNO toxin-antitoxin module